jgi:hypothetical protein
MPGNFFQMMIQCKNTLMELIAISNDNKKTKLEKILEKIHRDSIIVKSLYVV